MRKYLYLIAAMGLLVACQQGGDKIKCPRD